MTCAVATMQDPKTARLELEGFPEGIAFRPHGMHFQRETGELFVINHAYSQGGERIDVFKVSLFILEVLCQPRPRPVG